MTFFLTSDTLNYAAQTRLLTSKSPTLSCPAGDIYTLQVGAITADEAMYAGGLLSAANSSYYLYNGENYWTMTPMRYYLNNGKYTVTVVIVSADGALGGTKVNPSSGNVYYSLRPVINLKANTSFQSGGLGTSTKPYIVQ